MTGKGRLAPSPTGAQHLGNARTYLLAYWSARERVRKLVLRIEDVDSPRVKPWATQQAIDDLSWLGIDWDEGPYSSKPSGWTVSRCSGSADRGKSSLPMHLHAERIIQEAGSAPAFRA